jgi:hypothetical protein
MSNVDPFTNIPSVPLPVPSQETSGQTFLSNLRELNIGDGGNNVFRADKNGIWLGAKTFALAPFKVTMAGIATAGGFIAVGGAAADVNAYSTTISGGKITTNSIDANKIVTGSLIVGTNVNIGTAQDAAGVTTIVGNTVTTSYVNALNITAKYIVASASITSPSISGGSIIIGTGDNVFKADSNGIYLGNATFGSAPFRVNMAGAVTASSLTLTNASIGAGSSYAGNQISEAYIGTISAGKISVVNLSAINADMGTITAGTFKVSTRIAIQKSDTTAVAYLGQDPDSSGIWGFIANRGYGLMCRYSAGNYFRIFMDASSNDAVIDMPSPNMLKIQDNEGYAITRFYGRNAGFTNLGGMDMFGALRLYTSDTPPTGASNGMMFYHTTWHEVWVFKNGAWKALAFVP